MSDRTPSSVDQILRMKNGTNTDIAADGSVKTTALAKGRGGRVLFSLGPPLRKPSEEKLVGPTAGVVKTYVATPLEKSLQDSLDGNEIARIAFDRNPEQVSWHIVYQAKPRMIPEWLAKRISHQDDLVAAIVNTRANQIRSFGIPRPDRHSNGFVIEPKEGIVDDLDDKAKADLDKKIERARDLLVTCGSNEGVAKTEQLSFGDFLFVLAQNAVVVGKVAVEKIRDHAGRVHSFRYVDAGTIFPATTQQTQGASIRKQAVSLLARLQNRKESELSESLDLKRWIKDEYSYVQAIDMTPRQVFTDDQLVVKNFYPVPDIEMMGHPITPLDTVISAVMTHINITTYSKVYFQSGRAAKGMLVIKSDDADNDMLQYMQEHFQANINSAANAWRLPVFAIGPKDEIAWTPIDQQGARDSEFQYLGDAVARIIMSAFQISPDELPGWSYLSKGTSAQTLCLHPDSRISTTTGFDTIGHILGDQKQAVVKVWDGRQFLDATVFRTEKRKQARTTLGNGVSLVTSPEHRFRVVGDDGMPAWKHQKDLTSEDWVLVNRHQVPGTVPLPSYQGRELTEDMMEVLGWLTGDGNIAVRKKQQVLTWYYHQEKERDIWLRHDNILKNFGLTSIHSERDISDEEVDRIKARKGTGSAASSEIRNRLYNTDFVRWMRSLGFTSSTEGKTIPSFVYGLPERYRGAFLRGMFSADGTLDKSSGMIRIVIHDDRLRDQTRQLLLGLGIRTQFSEGKFKYSFGAGPVRERDKIEGQTTLNIKDKNAFFDRVGFLQAHKQPLKGQLDRPPRWERAAPATQRAIVRRILASGRSLTRSQRNNLVTVLNPNIVRGVSTYQLVTYMQRCGIEVPSWMQDFYVEPVISVVSLDGEIEMVDLTVDSEEHAFISEGILTHNSESSNEYRLEAHRDLGIRPLIQHFEELINTEIFPIIDADLAKICRVRLMGLDSESAEKEATRLAEDMPLHMTMNQVLEKVEKDPLPAFLGGDIVLSPSFHSLVLDKYLTVGVIRETLLGIKGSAADPRFDYVNNPMYFQQQQLIAQAQQVTDQKNLQQQQLAQQQQQAQQNTGPQGKPGAQENAGPGVGDEQARAPAQEQKSEDLHQGVKDALAALTKNEEGLVDLDQLEKSEEQLTPGQRRVLKRHRQLVKEVNDNFKKDAEKAHSEIVASVEELLGKVK